MQLLREIAGRVMLGPLAKDQHVNKQVLPVRYDFAYQYVCHGEPSMRIAILGARGQLGRDLLRYFPGTAISWTRDDCDLSRADSIRSAIFNHRPQVIINCAAYNFVDQAESEPRAAFAVNSWGVRELALECRDADCMLVQISTDYVFGLDTSRESPLTEADPPGPVSVYGVSKLAGEYFVRSIVPRHLVIRTCGLYGVWGSGGKGGNFVETMLRLGHQGKPVRVVNDQRCTPTYTADLAAMIARLVEREQQGLIHITNSGSCTWYEFAREIFQQAGLNVDLSPIPSSDYPQPARRPTYSVLSGERLTNLGYPPMRPWPEALAAYLEERRSRTSNMTGMSE